MAPSKSFRRSIRFAATAASVALLVVTVPGGANAAPSGGQTTDKPTTSADAKKQLTQMSQKLEIITEQYNGARIELTKRRAEAVKARAEVKSLQRQVHTLQGKVKKVAVSAYQNGHLSSFSSFVTSKSPQAFLDQLSTLDVIAQKQTASLSGLAKAEKGAKAASARDAKAEAAAKTTLVRITAQKKTIGKQVNELTTLMNSLSAKELAAYRAAQSRQHIQEVAQQQQQQQQQQVNDGPVKQPTPPTGSASGKAAIAVKAAEAELGKPYVWGAAGPDSFDCSGLMLWAWAKAGVSLPHQSAQQYNVGTHVSEDQLQPGDLVFYYSPIHHVAMYVGNGQVIQAPDFGVPVGYAPVNSMPFTGATRVG